MVRRWLYAHLLLLLLLSPALATNGPALQTVGSKGPVSLPIGGDAQTAFRMPSSIGWATTNSLDVDLFLVYIRSQFNNNLNDFDSTSSSPGGNFALLFAPGRPDFEEDPDAWDEYSPANKWTFGIGEFIEFAGGGSSRVNSTAFPEGVKTSTDIIFLTTALTTAYTPTEWLSLGLSFHFTFTQVKVDTLAGGIGNSVLNGSPQIAGVPLPGNPSYADFLELFSNGNGSDPSTFLKAELTNYQLGGVLSVSFKPLENLGIGLAYRPRSYSPDFDDTGTVDANRNVSNAIGDLPQVIQQLFLDTLPNGVANGFETDYDIKVNGIRIPRTIRGSIAYWPLDNLLFAFEVAWIEWHRAFRRLTIEATNGTNQDVNFAVGSTGVNTTTQFRFRNQFVFSFYTAYGITDKLTLRAGVNYGKSPVNLDHAGNGPNPLFIDLNLSLGAGYRLFENFDVNVLFEYGVQNTEKSDGTPDSITAKFTEYTADQYFIHLGFTYRF